MSTRLDVKASISDLVAVLHGKGDAPGVIVEMTKTGGDYSAWAALAEYASRTVAEWSSGSGHEFELHAWAAAATLFAREASLSLAEPDAEPDAEETKAKAPSPITPATTLADLALATVRAEDTDAVLDPIGNMWTCWATMAAHALDGAVNTDTSKDARAMIVGAIRVAQEAVRRIDAEGEA